MAVTWIKEIARGRDGEENNLGVTKYTRRLHVKVSDKNDREPTVIAAIIADPLYGPTVNYPGDTTAFPSNYRANLLGDGFFIYEAEIEYSNEKDNPLSEPADIETDGTVITEVMVVDANGDAVCNSAGDPFVDPPIERERSRGTITFSKNVATPPAWIYSLNDTRNQSGFSFWSGAISVATGTAKLAKPPRISGPHTRNGTTYYTVSGQIDVDLGEWKAHPADAGFRRIDLSDPTQRVAITLGDGTPATTPVFLDGSGQRLSNPGPSTVVIGEFDRYPLADWSALVALLV